MHTGYVYRLILYCSGYDFTTIDTWLQPKCLLTSIYRLTKMSIFLGHVIVLAY